MNEEIKKKIEQAASAEKIYEPKYGGKDHSGYDTRMLYEINYEREECFEKGAVFGYSLAEQEIARLNKIIEIKEKERAEWATMCIKKQEKIELLEMGNKRTDINSPF